MMSNVLYLARSRSTDAQIEALIGKYKLELCYDTKKEKVLKNETMLLWLKRRYAFLRLISEDEKLFSEVKQKFRMQ